MDVPSRTLENLARGLAEKNLARSRYMLAAGAAHRDGLAVVELLFVRTAEQERVHGRQFERVAQVDETHGDRFARWAGRLEDGELFARPLPCLWRCTVCGHTQYEEGAPERCPLFLGPQSQFLALEGRTGFKELTNHTLRYPLYFFHCPGPGNYGILILSGQDSLSGLMIKKRRIQVGAYL